MASNVHVLATSTVTALILGGCSMKLTPTRHIREMAEAAANPATRGVYDLNDIRVTTLNQAFANTVYTCVDHRNVRTYSHGNCPVCGSELTAMPRRAPMPEVRREARAD